MNDVIGSGAYPCSSNEFQAIFEPYYLTPLRTLLSTFVTRYSYIEAYDIVSRIEISSSNLMSVDLLHQVLRKTGVKKISSLIPTGFPFDSIYGSSKSVCERRKNRSLPVKVILDPFVRVGWLAPFGCSLHYSKVVLQNFRPPYFMLIIVRELC